MVLGHFLRRPALDLPAERRNSGTTSSARRVHAALRTDGRRSGGAAAGLREESEAFTATPTSVPVR
ncbi:hypothetical protein RND61_03445 [Streptomyces sp. TRM76323]|uniref:Uncharacterized protein n=1 Tax=Streptomyces tamarix TaxID=3078565 RepID=A0ABU3QEE1_9ACTN|nr:hypothetical protein [Streptomyces tamarix]MDT9681135.1 hypothetical protein [Streptomyces tamarix]